MRCKGYTLKNKRCKNNSDYKYCYLHTKNKQKGGYNNCNIHGCSEWFIPDEYDPNIGQTYMPFCCPDYTPSSGYCRKNLKNCYKTGINITSRKEDITPNQLQYIKDIASYERSVRERQRLQGESNKDLRIREEINRKNDGYLNDMRRIRKKPKYSANINAQRRKNSQNITDMTKVKRKSSNVKSSSNVKRNTPKPPSSKSSSSNKSSSSKSSSSKSSSSNKSSSSKSSSSKSSSSKKTSSKSLKLMDLFTRSTDKKRYKKLYE